LESEAVLRLTAVQSGSGPKLAAIQSHFSAESARFNDRIATLVGRGLLRALVRNEVERRLNDVVELPKDGPGELAD
jgi:hypothetical protein